jgi:hypothetical protein
MIPFDDLYDYLKEHVVKAFPETFHISKERLLKSNWYPAIEITRKDGPVQLERNGRHLRHAKDFVKYLHSSAGPKGSKRLHLCWEEVDPDLSTHVTESVRDIQEEMDPPTKRVKRSGDPDAGNKAKEKRIKKEVESRPREKIKQEPKIKEEGSNDRSCSHSRSRSRSLPAKLTLSEAFQLKEDEGMAGAEAENDSANRVITRRLKH